MNSVVIQLQQDALNKDISIGDILRKAKVVAKKLSLSEFSNWIDFELNGYGNSEDVPAYRTVRGTPQAFDPYRGSIPLQFGHPEVENTISTTMLFQKISEIEDLILAAKDGTGLSLSFSSEQKAWLMNLMEVPMEPSLKIDRSRLVGVVDSVRNTVLDWTLKLEEQGILGDGMTFSEKERSQAIANHYHIQNVGVLGNVTDHASVKNNQNAKYTTADFKKIEGAFKEIERHLTSLENPKVSGKISEQISDFRLESSRPTPNSDRLKGYLTSIKAIAEGATGSLVASGIVGLIAPYL